MCRRSLCWFVARCHGLLAIATVRYEAYIICLLARFCTLLSLIPLLLEWTLRCLRYVGKMQMRADRVQSLPIFPEGAGSPKIYNYFRVCRKVATPCQEPATCWLPPPCLECHLSIPSAASRPPPTASWHSSRRKWQRHPNVGSSPAP